MPPLPHDATDVTRNENNYEQFAASQFAFEVGLNKSSTMLMVDSTLTNKLVDGTSWCRYRFNSPFLFPDRT